MMGLFANRGDSGFSWYSTAEEVTRGIDGTGLTAVITGASSGIGIETTRVLALRGVHVIMAVRNVSSGNEVKEMILKELPSAKIDILEVDLSSFASIRKFASEFNARDLPLNILINNAGIMGTPFLLSSDGFELQFATNHLGHFLLTELLLENMAQSSSRSSREGRIVIISSQAHMVAYKEGIRFDKINDQSAYNAINAYGQSKLANILHANELSRLLKEKRVQVMVNSLHPGSIYTNIFRNIRILDFLCRTFGRMMFKNVEQGAATTCYLALHPQVKGITGKYFSDSNIASPSAKSTDMELAKKLWDFSSEMTGLHSG